MRRENPVSTTLVRDHLTAGGLAYWLMDDGGRPNYSKDCLELKRILY
jgi:hypothetical protein